MSDFRKYITNKRQSPLKSYNDTEKKAIVTAIINDYMSRSRDSKAVFQVPPTLTGGPYYFLLENAIYLIDGEQYVVSTRYETSPNDSTLDPENIATSLEITRKNGECSEDFFCTASGTETDTVHNHITCCFTEGPKYRIFHKSENYSPSSHTMYEVENQDPKLYGNTDESKQALKDYSEQQAIPLSLIENLHRQLIGGIAFQKDETNSEQLRNKMFFYVQPNEDARPSNDIIKLDLDKILAAQQPPEPIM
jgi:hypothetical protein